MAVVWFGCFRRTSGGRNPGVPALGACIWGREWHPEQTLGFPVQEHGIWSRLCSGLGSAGTELYAEGIDALSNGVLPWIVSVVWLSWLAVWLAGSIKVKLGVRVKDEDGVKQLPIIEFPVIVSFEYPGRVRACLRGDCLRIGVSSNKGAIFLGVVWSLIRFRGESPGVPGVISSSPGFCSFRGLRRN